MRDIFQSTLPRGSDTYRRPDYGRRYVDFNPRSLAGATNAAPKVTQARKEFQSTLPRGSDKLDDYKKGGRLYISIHAPSRERQLIDANANGIHQFQSTLPRGSDIKISRRNTTPTAFQSTLPRGSDREQTMMTSRHRSISIHAPSRERHSYVQGSSGKGKFQSTLPRGSDNQRCT